MDKLKELIAKDELLLQKLGLLLGSIFGLLVGGVVTKRADEFENLPLHEILEREEKEDGSEII